MGEAQTFQVQIADDCNNPLVLSSSSIAALFDSCNGGALVANLTSANLSGLWTGAWTPLTPGAVQVRVYATQGQTFGGISTPPPRSPWWT